MHTSRTNEVRSYVAGLHWRKICFGMGEGQVLLSLFADERTSRSPIAQNQVLYLIAEKERLPFYLRYYLHNKIT